jgi:hypothetical protein
MSDAHLKQNSINAHSSVVMDMLKNLILIHFTVDGQPEHTSLTSSALLICNLSSSLYSYCCPEL